MTLSTTPLCTEDKDASSRGRAAWSSQYRCGKNEECAACTFVRAGGEREGDQGEIKRERERERDRARQISTGSERV